MLKPGSSTCWRITVTGLNEPVCPETRCTIAVYCLMMGCNENLTFASGFFPSFDGKTWEGSPEGGWQKTYAGDGIVPHSDSVLTGATVEILPANPAVMENCSDDYCHIHLPRNPEVVDRVMWYLNNYRPPLGS